MITIKNTDFTSNISLASILMVRTKEYMLDTCKKLQLVDEFVKAGPNQYITKKMRKTYYKLQKYSLILTYKDFETGEWKMLMPDSVRESLAVSLPAILSIAEKTGKAPKYKDLRMLTFLNSLSNY